VYWTCCSSGPEVVPGVPAHRAGRLGQEERTVSALDSSTVARLRANTQRCALLGKRRPLPRFSWDCVMADHVSALPLKQRPFADHPFVRGGRCKGSLSLPSKDEASPLWPGVRLTTPSTGQDRENCKREQPYWWHRACIVMYSRNCVHRPRRYSSGGLQLYDTNHPKQASRNPTSGR
jgi:hypothetical protein